MKSKQKVNLSSNYYSFRPPSNHQKPPKRFGKFWLPVAIVLILSVIFTVQKSQRSDITARSNPKSKRSALAKTITKSSVCDGNVVDQKIVVDISEQHVWMCSRSSQVYDGPVTTGAYKVADNATPTGTWKILAKYTKLYLSGSDSQGSWNDYVNYWLPFDGDYGFHDATWQKMPFGSSKYPTEGSHGCVRLSLETATWLYGWANVGTVVTIRG